MEGHTENKPSRDIGAEAEAVMQKLKAEKDRQGRSGIKVTTRQLRKILSAVNVLNNKVEVYRTKEPGATTLPSDLAAEVQYLKVRVAYQAGRDKAVRQFVDQADLIGKINDIGHDLAKYEAFARYMEALVAYHKYYGGRD